MSKLPKNSLGWRGGHKPSGRCISECQKSFFVADCLTVGAVECEREITDGVLDGKYHPAKTAIDIYNRYKENIVFFTERGFKCFSTHSPGCAFFRMGMRVFPIRTVSRFMTGCLTAA